MSAQIKPPGVAGVFYPQDPQALAHTVKQALNDAHAWAGQPKALIVPHAGYGFSGPIAATGWKTLAQQRATLKRVVLLGPAHRLAFEGMAVLPVSHWQTPLGLVRTDQAALQRALQHPNVVALPPAFAQEHALEVQLPWLQAALGDCAVLPILIGRTSVAAVAQLMSMLWGGPETVVVVSSDLSHYLTHDAAQRMDQATTALIEQAAPQGIGPSQACGHLGIAGLLAHARARDLRITALDVRTSADTVGNPERVVGYGCYAFEPAQQARLLPAERAWLLEQARASIATGLSQGAPMVETIDPASSCNVRAQRKVFVTLTQEGRLRGCIGSVQVQRSLVEDVRINAYKAAFNDPRFVPLTLAELATLQISISVLSHARPMQVVDEAALLSQLVPEHDGLILADGPRSALFLPSVWQSLPDRRQFVQHLRRKAGLPSEGWSPTMRAYRFSTECFATSP